MGSELTKWKATSLIDCEKFGVGASVLQGYVLFLALHHRSLVPFHEIKCAMGAIFADELLSFANLRNYKGLHMSMMQAKIMDGLRDSGVLD